MAFRMLKVRILTCMCYFVMQKVISCGYVSGGEGVIAMSIHVNQTT